MYKVLKRISKRVLPESFLKKNERYFRSLVSFTYKGNSFQCNICDVKLHRFVSLNHDLLCPACGSRSRTRQLYRFITENSLLHGSVLHFSPPKCLYDTFKKVNLIDYFASDFEDEFTADYQYDITKINLPDASINLLICYHILEHIEDDVKAVKEIYRVLKPSGIALIQTPFKKGDLYEDSTIVNPEDREKAFGQKDHVRIYSIVGLTKRLENAKLHTEIMTFNEEKINFNGLSSGTIIIGRK